MTQSRPASAPVGRRYSLAVFIGRFSPPHNGHLAVIEQALRVADTALIVIGSANSARRFDYLPFTAAEREQMVRLMLTADQNRRVRFAHTEDQGNMPKWTKAIRAAANEIELDDSKITLIGHSKDRSSYYLKGFPNWASQDVDNYLGLSATTFRQQYFQQSFSFAACGEDWKAGVPNHVYGFLIDFSKTEAYEYLVKEAESVARDKAKYGEGPFVTGDSVVIQGDSVLMIERGNYPFKGHLAFPGGFVEKDERMVDAIFRELDEETGLKVPAGQLRQSLIHTELLDGPFRDPRGRVISLAGLIYLNPTPPANMTNPKDIRNYVSLPRVKARDDAKQAFWIPIADVQRDKTAFDHFMVLQTMLDFIPKGE